MVLASLFISVLCIFIICGLNIAFDVCQEDEDENK